MAAGTPAHVVVLATGDAKEKANLELLGKLDAAFDKHDAAAYGALLADSVVWSEAVEPKDGDKAARLAGLHALWSDVPDVHADVARTWAAGDYVVAEEKLVGTPKKGKPFAAPALMIVKLDAGKVAAGWLFFQSKAIAP